MLGAQHLPCVTCESVRHGQRAGHARRAHARGLAPVARDAPRVERRCLARSGRSSTPASSRCRTRTSSARRSASGGSTAWSSASTTTATRSRSRRASRRADGRRSTASAGSKLEAAGLLARGRCRRGADGEELRAASVDPRAAGVHRASVQVERGAWQHFQALAPAYRRNFVVWIHTAKRPETRERRIRESIALLAAGKKLGLK